MVLASVGNYLDRMTEEEASSYGSLRRQLARIVKRGSTGKKAGRGLLCGERLMIQWCGAAGETSVSPAAVKRV